MNSFSTPRQHRILPASLQGVFVRLAPALLALGLQSPALADLGELEAATLKWASELSGEPASQLAMRPLDRRVEVQSCSAGWGFDMPFGPGQAIRARCQKPKQQFFVSLESRPEGLIQATAAAQASGSRVAEGAEVEAERSSSNTPGQVRRRVLVATHNLAAHTPLSPDHFTLKEIALNGPEKDYFTSPTGLEFAQVLKPIKAGEALRGRDVRPAVLIKRGQTATLSVSRVPGLSIHVRVEALQDGRYGEQIRFRNTESGRTTIGEVVAKGQAVAL